MAAELIPDHLMQFWGGSESSFGAGPATYPLASNAVEHISVDSALPVARVMPNEEATGNRGRRPNLRGSYDPVQVKILAHLRGSGSPGDLPETDFLFRAGGFEATVVPGTSVTYKRSRATAVSAWMWGVTSDGTFGVMYGGIAVTEGALPDVGTDACRIETTAQAARGAVVYKTQVGSGGIDNSDTELPLAPGHGWVIAGVPAFIQIGNEVMKVTAVDGDTATVVRGVSGSAASHAAGDPILAYVPDRNLPDVPPIGEIGGGFQLDDGGGAVDREFVKAGLTWRTGVDLMDKPALGAYRTGLVMMKYGEDAVRLTTDVVYTVGGSGAGGGMNYLHAHADSGDPLEVTMTVGTEPGNQVTITLPLAEVVELSAPLTADGPRKGTVIFGAYSLDGNDFTIRFH